MRKLFIGLVLIMALATAALPATPSPADAQGSCGTAPPPRLTVGATARVTVTSAGVGNNLRQTFTSNATVLGVMPEGEIVGVIGGPQCSENYWWWQVRRWKGQVGWSAEGNASEYWLEPWPVMGAAVRPGDPPDLPDARIAYRSGTGSVLVPYVMDASGANKLSRGTNNVDTGRMAWSPDGTTIAYSDGNDIWLVSEGGVRNLTTTSAVIETWPTWSPDGTRIAYVSEANGSADIHTRQIAGAGAANLTNTPAAIEGWPAWSPDGTRIAFASDRDGNMEIYTMSAADGSNVRQESFTPTAAESQPGWSPDTASIAALALENNVHSLVLLERANSRALTTDLDVQDYEWSPTGGRIAFTAGLPNDPARMGVFSVRYDGDDLFQYTVSGATAHGVTWSPDGEYLAFADNSTGNFEVYTIRTAGFGLANLTNNAAAQDDYPVFHQSALALPSGQPAPGQPAPTSQPAQPAPPSVNPADRELLLIYDPSVPVFTLQNVSGGALNLTPLSFQGGGVTAPAGIWSEFSASSLDSFQAMGCLMLWPFGLPEQPAPPECGAARQGWVTNSSYTFWTAGSFDVLYNGTVAATCQSAAGRCEVDLP